MSTLSRRRKVAPGPRPVSHRPELAVLLLAWVAAAAALVLVLGGCSSGSEDGPTPRTLEPLAGPAEVGGQGLRDGQGQRARLSLPSALAAAPDGSVWLLDDQGVQLRRVSADGLVQTVKTVRSLPGPAEANGQRVSFEQMHAIAVAPDGTVHLAAQRLTWRPTSGASTTAAEVVADNRWVVLRMDASAAVQVVMVDPRGAQGMQGARVAAMAFDGSGRLHVADGSACAVWRLDADGSTTAVYTPPGASASGACASGSAARVNRLAFDSTGRLVVGLTHGELWQVAAGSVAPTRIATGVPMGAGCGQMVYLPDGRLVLSGVGAGAALHVLSADGRLSRWVGDDDQRGWADGDAASARFGRVCALAVDRSGRLLAADHENHTVRSVDARAQVGTWVGLALQTGWRDGAGSQALFGADFGLAAAGQAVWVADGDNHALRQVGADGQVRTLAGRGQVGQPGVDGPEASATWATPRLIALNADGSAWVSDGIRLRRRAANGSVSTLPGDAAWMLRALAAEPAGSVAVLEATLLASNPEDTTPRRRSSITLARIATDGSRTVLVDGSSPLIDPAQWLGLLPHGLCRGADGSLFFTLGHAVWRRDGGGTLTRWAGHLTEGGATDGPGDVARFSTPWGLACDEQGRVYVADAGNHTVRRIDTHGAVDTVLGRAGVTGAVWGPAPGGLDSPTRVVLTPDGLVVGSGLGLVRARW